MHVAVSNAGMNIETIPWCQQSGSPFPHFCSISLQKSLARDRAHVLCPAIKIDFSPESHPFRCCLLLTVAQFELGKKNHPFLDPEDLEGARISRNAEIPFLAVSNQEYVFLTFLCSTYANSAASARLRLAWFQALSLVPSQKTGCKAAMGRILYHLYQLFTDARRQVVKQRHGIISADDLQARQTFFHPFHCVYNIQKGYIAKIISHIRPIWWIKHLPETNVL